MSDLATWLRDLMEQRGLTQSQLSAHARVSHGTLSDILTKGHIPRTEALFRLADTLGASHVDALVAAGHLTRADQLPGADTAGDAGDHLTWQLITEFRQLPDPFKPDALASIRTFVRLAKLPRPTRDLQDSNDHS